MTKKALPLSEVIRNLIQEKSFGNLIVFLIIFPGYLYLVKTQILITSIPGLGFLLFFVGYLYIVYRNQWRQYQVPINLILSSTLFMRVIAGNTIPTWIVVIVLGILMFLTQEVISYNEYRSSEMMRQIVLSSVIFSTFLLYSYVFGSIFVNNLGPVWLGFLCFVGTLNVSSFAFWVYKLKRVWFLALLIGLVATQMYVGLRVMPYGHLTLSVFLVLFVFFSVLMFRDAFLQTLTRRKVIERVIGLVGLVFIMVVTAYISVI